MSESITETAASLARPLRIREIKPDQPWRWMAEGWKDLWRRPALSLGYGLAFSTIALLMLFFLVQLDWTALVLMLAGGFLLLGPLLAVGLYEMSRRYAALEEVSLRDVAFVGTKSPVQLAYMGVALMLLFLVWVRTATLLFALFQGTGGFPPLHEFIPHLLFTQNGLAMLVIGSAVGALLAFAAFAISVIAVPILMTRDVDVMTAIIASLTAVKKNFWPMLLWAWLVAFFTAVGLATLFLGLIVTFPLIGHATWHAYQDLVED